MRIYCRLQKTTMVTEIAYFYPSWVELFMPFLFGSNYGIVVFTVFHCRTIQWFQFYHLNIVGLNMVCLVPLMTHSASNIGVTWNWVKVVQDHWTWRRCKYSFVSYHFRVIWRSMISWPWNIGCWLCVSLPVLRH